MLVHSPALTRDLPNDMRRGVPIKRANLVLFIPGNLSFSFANRFSDLTKDYWLTELHFSIPSREVSILWSYLDITLLFSSYVYLIFCFVKNSAFEHLISFKKLFRPKEWFLVTSQGLFLCHQPLIGFTFKSGWPIKDSRLMVCWDVILWIVSLLAGDMNWRER